MKFMGNAGKEIGEDNQRMIEQVGAAKDAQAELTANQTIQNAMQVYEESGSFSDITPQALTAAEPSFTYVTAASNGPNTVSVAATDGGVGLAVQSSSGTCLYAFVQRLDHDLRHRLDLHGRRRHGRHLRLLARVLTGLHPPFSRPIPQRDG